MHSTRIANLDEVRAWQLAGTDGSIEVQFEPTGNTGHDRAGRARRNLPHAEQPLAS